MARITSCPYCASSRVIPLTFSPPQGHRIDTDPVAAEVLRARYKCVGCSRLLRKTTLRTASPVSVNALDIPRR